MTKNDIGFIQPYVNKCAVLVDPRTNRIVQILE
jgi:hypothetical protein